ncbi:hypothetical protein EON65_40245 [archaeon]|nr:MAG: hypothetical protein EON65_40245 [archaeon]
MTDFHRVSIIEAADHEYDADTCFACEALRECIEIRDRWIGDHPVPPQVGGSICLGMGMVWT